MSHINYEVLSVNTQRAHNSLGDIVSYQLVAILSGSLIE